MGDRPLRLRDNPLLANTVGRYSVWGTDVGVMWDNGIADNPATTINEHQILIALGDTFSADNMSGVWRPNTIFRSSDIDLANGMEIPNGQWFNGNMFGGAPLGPNSTTARQVIFPEGLPAGVTLIPTAGISVPVAGSRVRRGSVRELHVGVPVGRPRAMVDELLRDRLVRRQRRDIPCRSEHRAVQPAVGR